MGPEGETKSWEALEVDKGLVWGTDGLGSSPIFGPSSFCDLDQATPTMLGHLLSADRWMCVFFPPLKPYDPKSAQPVSGGGISDSLGTICSSQL